VHPAVIVTRQVAIPLLANVAVVLVTSTIRGIPPEVPVGVRHGLDHDSVVNCDNIVTVRKARLLRYRGRLASTELVRLNHALRIALELD